MTSNGWDFRAALNGRKVCWRELCCSLAKEDSVPTSTQVLNGSNGLSTASTHVTTQAGQSAMQAMSMVMADDIIIELLLRSQRSGCMLARAMLCLRWWDPVPTSTLTLNGSNGFRLMASTRWWRSGFSRYCSAGDVNGDGWHHYWGSSGADLNGGVGESHVVFGKAGGFSANLNLSTLNGSNGFEINGINSRDTQVIWSQCRRCQWRWLWWHLIGAFAPISMVKMLARKWCCVWPSRRIQCQLNLSALNGSNGFKINGIDAGDKSQAESVQQAMLMAIALMTNIGASGANLNGQVVLARAMWYFGRADFTAAALNVGNSRAIWSVASLIPVMPWRQSHKTDIRQHNHSR